MFELLQRYDMKVHVGSAGPVGPYKFPIEATGPLQGCNQDLEACLSGGGHGNGSGWGAGGDAVARLIHARYHIGKGYGFGDGPGCGLSDMGCEAREIRGHSREAGWGSYVEGDFRTRHVGYGGGWINYTFMEKSDAGD